MSRIIIPNMILISKLWEKFSDSDEQDLFLFLQNQYPKSDVNELFPIFNFMCYKYRDKLIIPEDRPENYHLIDNKVYVLKVQKKTKAN